MDYQMFYQWLKDNKKMAERSAKDVVSRCKRVQKITKIENLSNCSENILVECKDYEGYSTFIKSQLKRALVLYTEFYKGRVQDGEQ